VRRALQGLLVLMERQGHKESKAQPVLREVAGAQPALPVRQVLPVQRVPAAAQLVQPALREFRVLLVIPVRQGGKGCRVFRELPGHWELWVLPVLPDQQVLQVYKAFKGVPVVTGQVAQ
jgi:hypothetical protein